MHFSLEVSFYHWEMTSVDINVSVCLSFSTQLGMFNTYFNTRRPITLTGPCQVVLQRQMQFIHNCSVRDNVAQVKVLKDKKIIYALCNLYA